MNLDLGYTRLILDAASARVLPADQVAYVLATAYWETNRTMLPVEEAYYLGRRADAFRKRLRYYPWHGRGFVQLTWERNYLRAGQELGVDLISDPDRAMDPDIAASVLVIGMERGWFTGRKLSDYIKRGTTDYVGARRIINGTDKAAQIAAIADEYLDALLPKAPPETLRRGARGALVAHAQALLEASGYTPGVVDGIFGSATYAAVWAFQKSAGLPADGIIGPATWAALEPVED